MGLEPTTFGVIVLNNYLCNRKPKTNALPLRHPPGLYILCVCFYLSLYLLVVLWVGFECATGG